MITLDTNVLLRIFIHDDPAQVTEVAAFVDAALAHTKLYVPSFTLLELVWVVKTKGASREYIARIVAQLLETPGFVIGQRETVIRALEGYKSGNADFADYLIHADGIVNGAPGLATFDTVFAREDAGMRKRPRSWAS
jgi:predicted nucleic-acid-binding protein